MNFSSSFLKGKCAPCGKIVSEFLFFLRSCLYCLISTKFLSQNCNFYHLFALAELAFNKFLQWGVGTSDKFFFCIETKRFTSSVNGMGEGYLPHDVWCCVPSGIRRHGQQKVKLSKCLEKDAALLKSLLKELWSKAQEKSSWRGTVVALCTSRCGKTQV